MRATTFFSRGIGLASLALVGLGGAACASGVTSFSDSGGAGGAGGEGTGGTSCAVGEDCAGLGDSCHGAACVAGVCVLTPANELGPCDDGRQCTQNDHCQGGACVGEGGVACPATDPCRVGVCDVGSDACIEVAGNDGAPCDDGNACTGAGICGGGSCQLGSAIDCSFLDGPCTEGVCQLGTGCVAQALGDGTACDDGQFCSTNDQCQSGSCTGVHTCPQPADPCLAPACDEQLDACGSIPGPDGTACDDKNACTVNETCSAGSCGGGSPANEGGPCDDGQACTGNDVCTAGACAGGVVTACVGGDGCCPAGCTLALDSDCTCGQNLALGATPSISSGGSVPPYTPAELNNGIGEGVCQWSWVDDNTTPSGAFIQYDWPAPVTVGSIYIATARAAGGEPPCSPPAGRNVASGSVQWWDGAQWVTAVAFAGQTDDVQVDLPTPVTTQNLRVYDLTTDPGNGNSMVYEWYVYAGSGCVP
ncbi:MAG: discoidin domain-containing protein [Polyangiaceae bacterium]|nr:discoidin domain-containing protein [Polyangiaceae bacterium]